MGNLTHVREKSGNSISGNHIDKIILIIMISIIKILVTYKIRAIGMRRRPALMKKVIPATYSPVSSVTVHV